MTKIRSGLRLVALSAAVVLGLGSVSASGDTEADETLRLHLNTDGTYFEYSNRGAPMEQEIATTDGCKITVDGPLALLSGSDHGPGMFKSGIGVKTNGQGSPCGQTDNTEELTFSLGADMPAAVQAALDLELTGSHRGTAKIDIVLSRGDTTVGTFQVRTGKAIVNGEGVDSTTTAPYTVTATADDSFINCHTKTSNSGYKNNCYVTIIPAGPFDTITFAPLKGEMSLKGGGDYGGAHMNFETVLTLQGFDGELGCVDDNNTASIEEGTVFGQITRLENTDGSDCVVKPYNLSADVGEDTLSFVPHDNPGAPQPSAYQATLMFAPETATMPFPGLLEYDQDDDGPLPFQNMPWCTGDAYANPNATGSIDTSVIPTGDTWCVVGSNTVGVGSGQIRTTWNVVGIGDPKFR